MAVRRLGSVVAVHNRESRIETLVREESKDEGAQREEEHSERKQRGRMRNDRFILVGRDVIKRKARRWKIIDDLPTFRFIEMARCHARPGDV